MKPAMPRPKDKYGDGIIIDSFLLIKLIKERPCLWDRSHIDYKSKSIKDDLWLEVARSIQPEVDKMTNQNKHEFLYQLLKKWYNIRDSYVKRMKKSSSKPYVYASQLQFIDSQYENYVKKEFFKTPSMDCEKDCNDDEDVDVNENESTRLDDISHHFISETYFEQDDDLEVSPKKARQDDPNETTCSEENVVAVLANLIEKEEDEDRAFFKSITPAVKALSVNAKFEFRIQVLKLLQQLRDSERQKGKKMKVEVRPHSESE